MLSVCSSVHVAVDDAVVHSVEIKDDDSHAPLQPRLAIAGRSVRMRDC